MLCRGITWIWSVLVTLGSNVRLSVITEGWRAVINAFKLRCEARLDALGVQVEGHGWLARREKVWLEQPF